MVRKQGRGHLSSIDLLPEKAEGIVAWAIQELSERNTLQKEIHKEFNEKLAVIGLDPISMSAFNRHSLRLAKLARRHETVRSMSSALSDRLDPDETDNLTIIAAETIKMLIFELLEDENMTPKGALELARALQAATNSQKVPVDRKRQINAQFKNQVDDALDKVVEEKGLGKDRADALKRELLGLKT